MHLVLWLASYGKVRKDELMGFLELTTAHRDVIERSLQQLIDEGRVEIGTYQKLSLAKNEEFIFGKAVKQLVKFGIPPYQLVAFLHNQGIYDTMDVIQYLEAGIEQGFYRSNGAGLVFVNDPPQIMGEYVDSTWYINMRLDIAQGVQ